MTTKNGDLPAMPLTGDAYTDMVSHLNKGSGIDIECMGLTKREQFAMAAMQGILANSTNSMSYAATARDAVLMADKLLAELER